MFPPSHDIWLRFHCQRRVRPFDPHRLSKISLFLTCEAGRHCFVVRFDASSLASNYCHRLPSCVTPFDVIMSTSRKRLFGFGDAGPPPNRILWGLRVAPTDPSTFEGESDFTTSLIVRGIMLFLPSKGIPQFFILFFLSHRGLVFFVPSKVRFSLALSENGAHRLYLAVRHLYFLPQAEPVLSSPLRPTTSCSLYRLAGRRVCFGDLARTKSFFFVLREL